MQKISSLHRTLVPTLLGLTVFVGIFIFRPFYVTYMDTSLTHTREEKLYTERSQALEEIQKFKKTFEASGSLDDRIKKIDKLDFVWNSAKVMSAITINDFTRGTSLTKPKIRIGAISVNKGTKGVNGLSLGNASFTVNADSVDDMVEFITYLTQESPYVFTIDGITLPIDTSVPRDDEPIGLNLSLGIYYFEP